MPEGPAERGVEATRARARAGARHAESIDGAEHSGSIEPVMAGRHAAAYGFAMASHSGQGQTAGQVLHAGLVVPAGQRERLERVCRYARRPPESRDGTALMLPGHQTWVK